MRDFWILTVILNDYTFFRISHLCDIVSSLVFMLTNLYRYHTLFQILYLHVFGSWIDSLAHVPLSDNERGYVFEFGPLCQTSLLYILSNFTFAWDYLFAYTCMVLNTGRYRALRKRPLLYVRPNFLFMRVRFLLLDRFLHIRFWIWTVIPNIYHTFFQISHSHVIISSIDWFKYVCFWIRIVTIILFFFQFWIDSRVCVPRFSNLDRFRMHKRRRPYIPLNFVCIAHVFMIDSLSRLSLLRREKNSKLGRYRI